MLYSESPAQFVSGRVVFLNDWTIYLVVDYDGRTFTYGGHTKKNPRRCSDLQDDCDKRSQVYRFRDDGIIAFSDKPTHTVTLKKTTLVTYTFDGRPTTNWSAVDGKVRDRLHRGSPAPGDNHPPRSDGIYAVGSKTHSDPVVVTDVTVTHDTVVL